MKPCYLLCRYGPEQLGHRKSLYLFVPFDIVDGVYSLECGHAMHNECVDALLNIENLDCYARVPNSIAATGHAAQQPEPRMTKPMRMSSKKSQAMLMKSKD